MPVVELNAVSKSYGSKRAVCDLSLTLQSGAIHGLLGPNGSGKTSTIRMMLGITRPDSGSVHLFGGSCTRAALRRVGYLPEERGLYKKMRVLDQLVFLAELRGLSAAAARRVALSWCERLDLTGVLAKRTEELSKGMQQKVQFIATLLHAPALVLMDEPFSGLDPVNAARMEEALMELRASGCSILLSTHRMDQAEKLCDSICLIDAGRTILSGTLAEIRSRYPSNQVEIEFDGSNSFLTHPSVAASRNFPGRAELTLRDGADSQQLLAAAMQGARIRRFELRAPSLEQIFIEAVTRGGPSHA
jgi:ABC-2 type transport system ATP-binding protein